MIAALLPHPPLAHPHVLPPDTVVVREWSAFRRLLHGARAAVVVCPNGQHHGAFFDHLAEVCERPACAPVVVLAPYDIDVALQIPRGPARVLWLPLTPDELSEAIAAVEVPNPHRFMRRLADSYSAAPGMMRRAVERLCAPDRPPITSVTALASEMGCSRSYLGEVWRVSSPTCPPKRFVEAVALVHALSLARVESGRVAVADRLGIDESTLGRLAVRLTGRSFMQCLEPQAMRLALGQIAAQCQRPLGSGATRRDTRAS